MPAPENRFAVYLDPETLDAFKAQALACGIPVPTLLARLAAFHAGVVTRPPFPRLEPSDGQA